MKKTLIAATLALVSVIAFAKPAPKGVAFGTSFGNEFIAAVQEASDSDSTSEEIKVQGVTIKRLAEGVEFFDSKNNLIACQSLTFKSASEGNAVLNIKARIARAINGKTKYIVVFKNDTRVDGKIISNSDESKYRTGSFDITIPDVKKGDEIKIVCQASKYHRIESFSWDKAE